MAPEGYGNLVNNLLSAMTYVGVSTIFIHSIRSFIPSKLIEDNFNYYLELITRYFTRTLTMVIEEYNGLVNNEILKLKKIIIDDLDRFVKRKHFNRRVGKAWKRGYFLYGPPGTGKWSLIAAMANYLNFDIYDLELKEIPCNSYLRSILLATANRSILVIEDIDCSVDFESRQGKKVKNDEDDEKVTLSEFLNFIDGLWSNIADERIIVFTTNHKEKLDPALLRPGRMDMHILMSYCTPCGFKTLVSNYSEIKEHHLFKKIYTIY